jgi:tetratricopeptide (TPR) repeat protein
MVGLLFLTLLAPPDGDHRDALARYGSGILKQNRDQLVSAQTQFEAAAKADPTAAAPLRALIPVYLDLGRDPAAERAARKVLELDSDDAATGLALGKMLLAVRKPKEAAAVLAKAAASPRLAKDLATAIDVCHEWARAAESAGDFAAVEDAFTRRIELLASKRIPVSRSTGFAPEDVDHLAAETWERLGSVRLARKNWDGAVEAFRHAEKLFADPKGANDPAGAARVHRNLARTFAARGEFGEAVKHQAAYLAAKPPGLSPLVDYAQYLRQAGKDAVAELEALAATSPRSEKVKWVLAAERGRAGFVAVEQAKADLKQFAAGSTDPELFTLVAEFFQSVGRPEDALAWAEETFTAAKEAPYGSSKQKRTALVADAILEHRALAEGVIHQAATDFRTAKERTGSTWEFVAWLGDRLDQPDVAADAALAAVRAGRHGKEIFARAFRTLERRRKWTELITVCDRVTRDDRESYFPSRVARANALAELDRGAEAMAALDGMGQVDWNGDGRFILRVERIRVLNTLGQYQRAAEEGEKLLAEQIRPIEVSVARYALANSYLGLKQFDRAEAALRAVLEYDPDDALALNNLGYHLADEGRKLPEAEEMIRRAIALNRDMRARAGNPVTESGVYLDSLGWVLFRRGKLAEAKAAFEKAVTDPDGAADPLVWDHFGDVLYRLGEKEKAKSAWKRAEPGYAVGRLGREGGRKEELQRKLALFP